MKFIFTLFFLSLVWSSVAQQEDFIVNWSRYQNEVNSASDVQKKSTSTENYFGLYYNESSKSFEFSQNWQNNSRLSNVEITNVQLEPAPQQIINKINVEQLTEDYNLSYAEMKAREVSYSSVSISPVVIKNGVVQLVKSFSVTYNRSGAAERNFTVNGMQTITNSVFSTGNWYKFYVESTGVHRITRNFLSSLGMDVSSINPNNLKIVGHGGDMLPLRNSENQYFDPPEISIKVIGGEDGSFDNGDYILFYGKAVDDEWNEGSDTNLNLYADRSYYYISANGLGGNRVADYVEPSGTITETITTFDDYQYYEVDEYNIINIGRRWFGDRFDVQNERSYRFNFPDLVQNEPVQIQVYGASVSEINTNMSFAIGGVELGTLNFGTISDSNYGSGRGANFSYSANSDEIEIDVIYSNNGNPSSLGYLDYINVTAKRELNAGSDQFSFRNYEVANLSGLGEYVMSNSSQVSEVWDVTDPTQITSVSNLDSSNSFSFNVNLGEVREYVAVVNSDFYTPRRASSPLVSNQNLKENVFNFNGNQEDVDYLIITSDLLFQQANRLAQYRSNRDGLNIKVVLLEDIYEEFSSGKQDISAIRNFVKYVYDNAINASSRLKYVCLFGDASIDYKDRISGNNNIVPTYESMSSFSTGSSAFASDDFYGMMDPQEGNLNSVTGLLDIAVGRILADTPSMARNAVDKIIAYESRESFGPWRNNFVLISDDADDSGSGGYGLQVELDQIGDEISTNKPFVNVKKIHSDAYQQVSSAGGFRYPDVNEAITEAVEVGASVINYFGHGGENGLSSERIVTVDDILSWQNTDKYNLFVTVTCEFTRFDNPALLSPGEYILRKEDAGSVAMVTTTRSIFVSTGTAFNHLLAPYLFNYNNEDDSIAESVRKAKNAEGTSNIRVVFYFGDPSMKLQLPEPQIRLTSINEAPFTQTSDTLSALEYVKLGGEVQDQNGNLLSNYSGELSTSIFDKRIDRNTLNNDGNGVFEFTTLGEIIFRGKASVSNGQFEFDFVVPRDIAVPVGNGRVSFYAERNSILEDQQGYTNEILIGGINENAPEDNLGPEIQLYMNDESFVSGGITNESPFLLAKLSDENGINTASGIGHDLVAILDGDETNPFVVNDYYETELDDYTRGNVNYRLRDLEEGLHTLTFRAWDVYNNSSTAEIQFRVASDDDLKINRVLNYPNPFHNYTEFWFNHNRPFEPLEVQVQVFTVSGKIVWTQNQTITTDGFLAREITWDGKDDFGQAIGKGVYVYKLTVKSTLTNKKVEKFEKLVIL